MHNLSTNESRSLKLRSRWQQLSEDERAVIRGKYSDAQKKRWASMTPEERAWHIERAADGRRRSTYRGPAIARAKYRAAGVPEDEIEALMSMPKAKRKWARKRQVLYGVKPQETQRLLLEQQGLCRLCDVALTDSSHVDHDHATGAVRGLLCAGCNLALGHIETRGREWVMRAFDYLTTSAV